MSRSTPGPGDVTGAMRDGCESGSSLRGVLGTSGRFPPEQWFRGRAGARPSRRLAAHSGALLRALGCWLLALGLCGVELLPVGEGPLRVGDWAEWRIAGMDLPDGFDVASHPYLLIATDGGEVRRPAFRYRAHRQNEAGNEPEFLPDGEEELRVRHVFRAAGERAWSLHAADGRVLTRGSTMVAEAERATGPIRVAADGRRLRFADGTPYVPIGCNICWGTGPRRLDQMRGYLERFAAAGGDHTRIWLANWCGQIEGERPDQYRLDHAWLIDEVLRHAHGLGVHVTLVLDNAHDLVHGRMFPYGADTRARVGGFLRTPLSEQYRRRIAWTMARWGACDAILAWELFNELDEALIGQPKPPDMQDEPAVVRAWTAAASDCVADHDPDRRLITVSLASQPWYGIFEAPAIDLAQIHVYVPPLADVAETDKDGVAKLRGAMAELGRRHKPVLIGECGFQGSNDDNPANFLDPTGELMREQAWAGLMLGGCGGAMTWWWDVYVDPLNLWSVYTPLRRAVDAIDWADPALQPFDAPDGAVVSVLGWTSPSQALVWPRLRGDTWYARIIEAELPRRWPGGRGPTLRLTGFVAGADYGVTGLDMRSGEVRFAQDLHSTSGGSLFVHLPVASVGTVLVIRQR